MVPRIPRTALITWCPPDSRYAGGETIRKVLRQLPRRELMWCSLGRPAGPPGPGLPEQKVFAPRPLHWRLMRTVVEYIDINELQARHIARRIWQWLADFSPRVLWILPELSSVNVAWHLRRLSGLPLHATVHDAHEFSTRICVPRLYYPIYRRHVRRLFRKVASLDCISEPLRDHVRANYPLPESCRTMVFPSSVSANQVTAPAGPAHFESPTRRLGVCGAFRISGRQWQDFLDLLGTLPFRVEVVFFTDRTEMPGAAVPRNVAFQFEPYAETEGDVISRFVALGVQAGYLGLWKETDRRLFARTSLSSKLATYAASALPVVVDGPRESAAWLLVQKYGAGVCLDRAAGANRDVLLNLLSDAAAWSRLSEGARQLCRNEFALERNVERFAGLLAETADSGPA